MKKENKKMILEEIVKSAEKCKSSIYLENILKIADIYRKASDKREYMSLTKLQNEQKKIIDAVLCINNEKYLSYAHSLLMGLDGKKV